MSKKKPAVHNSLDFALQGFDHWCEFYLNIGQQHLRVVCRSLGGWSVYRRYPPPRQKPYQLLSNHLDLSVAVTLAMGQIQLQSVDNIDSRRLYRYASEIGIKLNRLHRRNDLRPVLGLVSIDFEGSRQAGVPYRPSMRRFSMMVCGKNFKLYWEPPSWFKTSRNRWQSTHLSEYFANNWSQTPRRVGMGILSDLATFAWIDRVRPCRDDPAWRHSTVRSLALEVLDSPGGGAMPILADALQDAGHRDATLLKTYQQLAAPGPAWFGQHWWAVNVLCLANDVDPNKYRWALAELKEFQDPAAEMSMGRTTNPNMPTVPAALHY
jgi:hypothetical protein